MSTAPVDKSTLKQHSSFNQQNRSIEHAMYKWVPDIGPAVVMQAAATDASPATAAGKAGASSRSERRFRLVPIVNEFAKETGVFGLNILRKGLSRAETIFWLLCTVFFACCTTRDLASLVQSFLRQDTLTFVSQINNSSITLDPPPSFAISHHFDAFEFEALSNDVQFEAMIENFLHVVEKFENESNVVPHSPEVELLFELSASMLVSMVMGEYAVVFPLEFGNASLHTTKWVSHLEGREYFHQIQSSTEELYRRFRKENIDFSKLLKVVVAHFCIAGGFRVDISGYYSGTSTRSLCRPENILGLNGRYAYLKLDSTALTFDDLVDCVIVSWNVAPRSEAREQKVVIDFSGMSNLVKEIENSIATVVFRNAGERIIVTASISAVFVRDDEITTRPCSNMLSRYDCKQQCYIRWLVEQCHCFPLAFAAAYEPEANITLCPYQSDTRNDSSKAGEIYYLVNCARIEASEERHREAQCYANCPSDCRTVTFVSTIERERLNDSGSYELKLAIQSFTFPLFEEKLAMTFDNFVSQFGGILGLYIGVSFAALVHIPIFALRKALQRLALSREPSESQNKNVDARGNLVEFSEHFNENSIPAGESVRSRDASIVSALGRVLLRLDAMDLQLLSFDRRLALVEGAPTRDI